MKLSRQTVYREHALLVGTIAPRNSYNHQALSELKQLATTAGAIVVDKVIQKKDKPDVAYYIGRGKVTEIKDLVVKREINVVIFDNNLSPAQVRNLEKAIQTKVIDRTELILDIFATHARTRQAKLQVELAQLEYTLPRLKHMWTHLSRIEGGIGIGQRGPGEKQLEIDRRLAHNRITRLKREIVVINKRRQREAESRSAYFTIALIGYTNAGKSTLMNNLTGTECFVEDKLFSTLDTKTHIWNTENRYQVLLSDTVGFIRNLPHHLVASFHATLQEVIYANLLLHIVDISQIEVAEHIDAVNKVLSELGCSEKPRLLLFNKVDQTDPLDLQILSRQFPEAIFISARKKTGLDELTRRIIGFTEKNETELILTISAGDGRLLAYLEEAGHIVKKSYQDGMVRVRVKLSPYARNRINRYLNERIPQRTR